MKKLISTLVLSCAAMAHAQNYVPSTFAATYNSSDGINWTPAMGGSGSFNANPTLYIGTLCAGGTTVWSPCTGSGGGGGGLTSFTTGNLSPIFTAALGPNPTTAPALAFTLTSANKNTFLAGPTTGSAAAPTYRAIVPGDIPAYQGGYPVANTFVGAGDSRMYGQGASTTAFGVLGQLATLPFFTGRYTVTNTGVQGQTCSGMTSYYAANVHTLSPAVTGTPGYLFIQIGYNDLNAGGLTATAVLSCLTSYWTTAHTDGWKIIQNTIIPGGLNQTALKYFQDVNANVKDLGCPSQATATTACWDELIDIANVLNNNYDPLLFNTDDTHPTNAGYAIWAALTNEQLSTQSSLFVTPTYVYVPGTGASNYASYPDSLIGLTSGGTNTAVGHLTCNTAATGGANICLGYNANVGFSTTSGAFQAGNGSNGIGNTFQWQTWNFLDNTGNTYSNLWSTVLGTPIASATTIAPLSEITHITGTAAISTITVPTVAVHSGNFKGILWLYADGAWTTVTGGNIANAISTVVGGIYPAIYDGTSWTILNPTPPSGGTVSSVFGRTGAVVSATNDYSFAQLSGTATAAQLPTGTSAALGVVKCDGTTITCASGVITAVGSGGGALTPSSVAVQPLGTAVSGTNYNSGPLSVVGSYWNGTAAAADTWTWTDTDPGGANPAVSYALSHSGSSGGAAVSIPFTINTSAVVASAGVTGTNIKSGETNVTYSATPVFAITVQESLITLTANLTSWTLAAGGAGQQMVLTFCQNATGGFTSGTTPSNVRGFFSGNSGIIGTTASKCNSQSFVYSANQTAWLATSTGVINE